MLYEAKQGTKAYEYIKSIVDAEFEEYQAYMKRVEEAIGFEVEKYQGYQPNHTINRMYEVTAIWVSSERYEILEKNGWKKDGKWYYLKTRRAYLYTIQDAGQPDEFLICANTDKHNLTSVSFVHQLQHLLFGLGLNSEMEV